MSKIEHDVKKCIGCGACTNVCSDLFEMNNGKSHLKGSKDEKGINVLELDDISCAQEAADICPVKCIKVSS